MPEDCDFDINGDEIKKEVKQGDIKEEDIKQEVDDEDALESNFEAKPNKLHLDKSVADHQYFKSGMSKISVSLPVFIKLVSKGNIFVLQSNLAIRKFSKRNKLVLRNHFP